MRLSGLSPDDNLVEYIELVDHPFFVGTQAHPEFRSRPDTPTPFSWGWSGPPWQGDQVVELPEPVDLTVE